MITLIESWLCIQCVKQKRHLTLKDFVLFITVITVQNRAIKYIRLLD